MQFLIFCFICFVSFFSYGKLSLYSKVDSDLEKKINSLVHQMTDEDKVSFLFVVPFYDNQVKELLVPGGLMLHSKVGDKLSAKELITKLKEYQKRSLKKYGAPAFVLVDSEGGTVSRLSKKRHKPFKGSLYYDLVSPYMMAQTGSLKLVKEMGEAVGEVLYSLGINMNLAPVVDLANPRKKTYMNERVFGSQPYQVQKFSQSYNEGLYEAGVIGVFKHFPGYGEKQVDTHKSSFVSSISKEDLYKSHMVPYRPLGGKGNPQAILMNIGLYTQLDSKNTAPLSPSIIQGLIRKELKFKGLVLPDALNMKGFKEKSFTQKVVKSLVAGNDLTLVHGASFKESTDSHKAVLKALKTGVLSRERLDEAVKRVFLFKLRLSQENAEESVRKRLSNYEQKLNKLYQVNQKVIQIHVDRFFNKNSHLKGRLTSDLNVGVFGSTSFYKNFKQSLSFFKSEEHLNSLLEKNSKDKGKVLEKLQQKNYVTFCYGNLVHRCKKLKDSVKKQMIVILTKPHYLLKEEKYLAVIPVYGPAVESGPLVLEKLIRKP